MENGKYIVLNERNIIIFDATLTHKEVAAGFLANSKVTSAGFIITVVDTKTNEVRASCFGRSVTLDIGSKYEDDERLAKFALGIV